MSTPQPQPAQPQNPHEPLTTPSNNQDSLLRRSWHLMADRFSPFSSQALASLPNVSRPGKYLRADGIPDTSTNVVSNNENGNNSNGNGGDQRPTVRDYHSINNLPPQVRVPKKIPTSVKVEGKVWFANERTWISWLNLSVLLGTLSLALFNASKENPIARNFAYGYAVISVGVLVYGFALYQHRITMIRRRDPGYFDAIWGPLIVSILLFVAILANFMIRVRELQRKNIPIPGADLVESLASLASFGFRSSSGSISIGNVNANITMGMGGI